MLSVAAVCAARRLAQHAAGPSAAAGPGGGRHLCLARGPAAPLRLRAPARPPAPALARGKATTSSSSSTEVATTAVAAGAEAGWGRAARQLLRDYKQLAKFRLSLLVVSTGAAGYVAGSGERVDWAGCGWLCAGTMALSSCANAVNQVLEVKYDGLMKRTLNRPLPRGRVSVPHAVGFAAVLGAGGVAVLGLKCNALTAGLGAANVALYTGVYTPLKQLHVANTWVGAVVGAIPPLMGWAAAAGGLGAGALVLAGALQFWQLPHFMSLAWLCRHDYAKGGYKMLPLVDPSGARTAAVAVRNSLYLLPLGFLAERWGVATEEFTYQAAALSTGMLAASLVFYTKPSADTARTLFRASLFHLPLYMASLMWNRIPQDEAGRAKHARRAEAQARAGGSYNLPLLPGMFPAVPTGMPRQVQNVYREAGAPEGGRGGAGGDRRADAIVQGGTGRRRTPE